MTTPPTPLPRVPRACRCGATTVLRRGAAWCTHCDQPAECPKGCVYCKTRDSICPVCGLRHGGPDSAARHEQECRRHEAIRERKHP